jgi:hypothetical protein
MKLRNFANGFGSQHYAVWEPAPGPPGEKSKIQSRPPLASWDFLYVPAEKDPRIL